MGIADLKILSREIGMTQSEQVLSCGGFALTVAARGGWRILRSERALGDLR
jgi:hypothetical protein